MNLSDPNPLDLRLGEPVLYDAHVHSPFCGHAIGAPESFVWQAWRRNLRGLYFTCHNPMPDGFSPQTRMRAEDWPNYLEMGRRLHLAFGTLVDVRLGLECDYLPGFEAFLGAQLASASFDYVLGSIHPAFPEYQERYASATPREAQHQYFELLAQAAETRLFDCLAHPDLIKNQTWLDWSVPDLLDPIRRCLDRVAAAGTAMEVNTAGIHKAIPELNPGPAILREMLARGIPVVLGSDAHQPERIADRFEEALEVLAEVGYREIARYDGRQRHVIPLATARASLMAVPG